MPRKCDNENCVKEHMTVKDLKEAISVFPDDNFVVVELNIDTPISTPVVDQFGMLDYVMAVDAHCQMDDTVSLANFHCPNKKLE